ncbi:MAG: hypothetical protein IJ139_06290 [Bacteroidaceae bacterium]|nr:hypothetical protein [Bacteroidaceae bacterium]
MQTIFAMNPRSKDSSTGQVLKKYHQGYAHGATASEIENMLESQELKATVEAIRAGHEELKETLPYLCPHYAQFNHDHRSQTDILPQAFTYETCTDIDDESMVQTALDRALALNSDPYSDWQDQVLYIEYSARRKLHIWIRIPKGMTIAEAQQAFCRELGVPYDSSCTTPERYIYMTGDTIYRSPQWLTPLSAEEKAERTEAYLNRGLDADGRPLVKPQATPTATKADTATQPRPADKRTRFIMTEIMKKEGINKADLVNKGGRHNTLKMILQHATQLLTKAELQGVLDEIMPASKDKEFQQLIDDFYTKYYDPSQRLTVVQKEIFRRSREIDTGQETGTASTPPEPVYGDSAPLTAIYASPQPPMLPQKLPTLVRHVTSLTPQDLKATVSQGMFPPLSAYPRKLQFLYADNQYRELRSNCLTISGTGTSKDSCLKQPLKHITMPMVARDNINRQRLKEYNQKFNSTKASNDKPPRPEGLIIQKVGADLTRARLAQLMDDSGGAFLYTHLHEFEQWYGIEGQRGSNCQFTNLKLADDEENPFGQERAGVQSVNYTGPLGLNWNASTTPKKIQEMFRYKLTDGPISRLCCATTPNTGLAAPMPRYGNYDERYDEKLRPYIENLMAATGNITCHPAIRMAERLKAECDQYTLVTQDEVFDNLSHRALVHAFRKACMLYAANGMKWEKTIEGFCRWSLHYDLWLKLHFFGDMIRKTEEHTHTSKRGPRNLLEQIKTDTEGVFTLRDAITVRIANNKDEAGTANMLSQWKARGYIQSMPDGKYKKNTAIHDR